MKDKVPLVINVASLTACGIDKTTVVEEAVEKRLSHYKFRKLPIDCNPLEMRTIEDLMPFMDAFCKEAFAVSTSRVKIRTDFITPLMHVIGSNLITSFDVKDIPGPYLVRSSTRKHMNRKQNISKTAYIIAEFLGRYRNCLFLWRRTRNLLIWPGFETSNELPYSSIVTASRYIASDTKLAPIFLAQNVLVANFASIYECIKESFMDTAIPEERIPLANRRTPSEEKMSDEEILWHCMCQLIGTFCPTYGCFHVNADIEYSPIDYPEDIDVDEIVRDFMNGEDD